MGMWNREVGSVGILVFAVIRYGLGDVMEMEMGKGWCCSIGDGVFIDNAFVYQAGENENENVPARKRGRKIQSLYP